MYAILAIVGLGLAGLSHAAQGSLANILGHDLVHGHNETKSVKLDGNRITVIPREGDPISFTDEVAAKEMRILQNMQSAPGTRTRGPGVSRVKNALVPRATQCGMACPESAGCVTQDPSSYTCGCLKDCGPEGEECFSTCVTYLAGSS